MKILYICTHNRCRSILSEALTNHYGEGFLTAASAGSQPVGEVHPLSIEFLRKRNIDTSGLKSESWRSFANFAPDAVITVCDSAAGETCPLWMGDSFKIHWALKDPSKIEGEKDIIARAFNETIDTIIQRVEMLKDVAKSGLSGSQRQQALLEISSK